MRAGLETERRVIPGHGGAQGAADRPNADAGVSAPWRNARSLARVFRRMNKQDYHAILSAIEQALAICDSYGDSLDEARARICGELRRMRVELRRQLGLPLTDAT